MIEAPQELWRWVANAIVGRRMELDISTQRELARRARASPATISQLENAEALSYQADTLKRVAVALQWPPDAILSMLHAGPPGFQERLQALEASNAELRQSNARLDRRITQLAEQLARQFPAAFQEGQ